VKYQWIEEERIQCIFEIIIKFFHVSDSGLDATLYL